VSWFKKSAGDAATPLPDAPAAEVPDVEPLRDDEVEWVRSTIARLADQDVRAGDIDDLGRHYDELLTAWLRLRETDRPDPRAILDQIGLALGQYVADHAALEWRVATTAHGPEIVLYGAQGAMLVYPTTLVSERWAEQDTRVLPALARAVIVSAGGLP
jgi:hypothetical protein